MPTPFSSPRGLFELLLLDPETVVDEHGRFASSLRDEHLEPLLFATKEAALAEMAAMVALIQSVATHDADRGFPRGRYTIAVVEYSDPEKYRVFETGGPDVLTFHAPARSSSSRRRPTLQRLKR